MSVMWEMLAGDTSRFAVRMAFLRDPDDEEAATPERAKSWGSFQLWVEGRNLCEQVQDGERIESTYWYLYPLLDWLVSNWGPMFHEERFPVRNVGGDAWQNLRRTEFAPPAMTDGRQDEWNESWYRWWQRHALWAAREGGPFPDVLIRRFRSQVEISWGDGAPPATLGHARFVIPTGRARFDPQEIARPLHTVMAAAMDQLVARLPNSRAVRGLKRRTAALARVDRRESNLAWLAGLGETAASVRSGLKLLRSTVGELTEAASGVFLGDAVDGQTVVPGNCHAALMFGCVSPTIRRADAMVLARSVLAAYAVGSENDTLRSMVRDEPVRTGADSAWTDGYQLALDAHAALDIPFSPSCRVDIDGVLQRLGVAVRPVDLADETIRAVSIASEEHLPTILLNRVANESEQRRRFTLAHELCHLLHDRSFGWRLAIASGPWAPRELERRANAFAAMFLMPPGAVQAAIASQTLGLASPEWLAQVAEDLGTSQAATREHLYNVGVLDETQRAALRRLPPASDSAQ